MGGMSWEDTCFFNGKMSFLLFHFIFMYLVSKREGPPSFPHNLPIFPLFVMLLCLSICCLHFVVVSRHVHP